MHHVKKRFRDKKEEVLLDSLVRREIYSNSPASSDISRGGVLPDIYRLIHNESTLCKSISTYTLYKNPSYFSKSLIENNYNFTLSRRPEKLLAEPNGLAGRLAELKGKKIPCALDLTMKAVFLAVERELNSSVHKVNRLKSWLIIKVETSVMRGIDKECCLHKTRDARAASQPFASSIPCLSIVPFPLYSSQQYCWT
ncbi:hypothetical protein EGR_03933 [Echinococcus granulosus]|uniref:Uncharacterized protein n=1 Tax=Echinococcus granulosus TaxID=6210 RepID=W6UJN1_ECHGR|nr:hypothetical protein EGR_03933 [Echinococcus granulosus]EUB61258.1 hypothetical protein EGR_03933 [Echinococcus granulosus]